MKIRLLLIGGVTLVLLVVLAVLSRDDYLLLGMSLAACLLVLAVLFFSVRQLITPLEKTSHTLGVAAAGNLDIDIHDGGAPEIVKLQDSVNVLLKTLREKISINDSILGNIVMPMALVDPDKTIHWVNESMVRLTEQSGKPADYYGKPFAEFFYNDHRETLVDKALREKSKQFVKTEMQSHKGNTKYISIAAAPILRPDGKIIGIFTSVMDFTNIKLKEDHIIAQNGSIARGVNEATGVSEQVSSSAEQLSVHIRQASRGAEDQLERTTEVATAVEQMNATIMEVARSAGIASDTSSSAQETAQHGAMQVRDVIRVMDEVNAKANELKQEMDGLGAQAEGIGRIMAVINDIADQTNLLALNAAIEAARAGEAGRGFAVVADEVRKLAEKTMQATNEVSSFIKAIQDSARKNLEVTEKTTQVIEQATELTHAAGDSLNKILQLVQSTDDQVRAIATASEEQSAASEEINRSTNEINRIAGETSQAMNNASNMVAEMAQRATALNEAMVRMKREATS